jgi:hypothetical protein
MLSRNTGLLARLKQRFAPPVVILGRWANEECTEKTRIKTDLANEDHCSCDDYLEKKRKEHIETKKDEDYLKYFMVQ